MHIRKTLIVIILCLSLSVVADFKTVSLAHEISLSNFSAPASENAAAIFKECDECDAMRVRVTANTRYLVNGKAVTLKEFRKSILGVRRREDELVIVLHHLESDTIEQISVTL